MTSTTYPDMTVEEIIELLAGSAGAEMVEIENVRRRAEYRAWQVETITEHMGEPLPGGPLIVGQWYDVVPGGGHDRSRKWRVCQYLGRERRRDRSWGDSSRYDFSAWYVFARWGAKAATDPYASATGDRVGVNARDFRVERITPDPKLLAKIAEKGRADREWRERLGMPER